MPSLPSKIKVLSILAKKLLKNSVLFHRKTSFFLKYFVQDCGWKRLCPAKSVKYLDIKIDKNLNGKDDVHDTTTKPNIANARLYKIRNSLNFHTFKAIY